MIIYLFQEFCALYDGRHHVNNLLLALVIDFDGVIATFYKNEHFKYGMFLSFVIGKLDDDLIFNCLLYTSPSPRD